MTLLRRALVLASLALAACAHELPARIVDPTASSRAELARVVSDALGGAPVALADDALTRESLLVIERKPPRDALGRPLGGRELGRPERFRLFRTDSACVLVHESDGRHYVLAATSCIAE
jgi:hypothetical protein